MTDNNSGGAGTYVQVDVDRTGFSTAGVLTVWVRTALITSATSTVFTATQPSSTGGGLDVFRISGMTKTGAAAVRQSAGQSTGTSGTTPAPVLGAAALTANPLIGAVCCGTNASTNLTPRTGWTEATDLGYNTPATGMETMFRSSGETGTTQTWGSTAPSAFASVVVEFDSSAAAIATAVKATGTGSAKNPAAIISKNSPGLELSGFTWTGISPADTINSVTVTINQFASVATMGAPTFELWDGAAAKIGATQTGAVSVSPANTDSAVFTGISYSQLATLRVRIYATNGSAPAGAVQNVNWAGLYVNTTPAATTAVLASGAGAAKNATAATVSATTAAAGLASAAGTALSSAFPHAAAATGAGTARSPAVTTAVSATAVLASGAGAAWSTAFPGAVVAAGAGAAKSPAVTTATSVAAGLAAGAGAAQSSAFPRAGTATGTGTAQNATASTTASGTATAVLATGAGVALSTAFPRAAAATGTGTAQGPAAAPAASTVLASGTGTARNASPPVPIGLASGAAAAQNATASTTASGTATAIVATGAGAAQSTAFPRAAVAAATGAAQSPAITVAATVAAVPATAAGASLQPATYLGYYRLMDGQSGRPGAGSSGTQPPASPTAYSGNYIAGLTFRSTSTVWLQGYWWYVPAGGDTGPVKLALWQLGGPASTSAQGTLVPGSTVTSGTLTAGQFNFVSLPAPMLLSYPTFYTAAVGYATTTGFPATTHQFGAGNPYSAGITNGPLTAPATNGTTGAQMPFSTASSDPAAVMPTLNDQDDNLWLDIQVTATPPAGESYRLWPNRPYSTGDGTNGGVSVLTDGYTMAVQFSLSRPCQLQRIWFYSATTAFSGDPAIALPARCAIWAAASQTVVSGTDNASVSWKKPDGSAGSAGDGWLYCDYSGTGVFLAASQDYKAAIWYAGGQKWRTVYDTYWASPGDGVNGIASGPLTAPNSASATPGQDSWNGPNLAWAYPNSLSFPENDWVDVEVTPGISAAAVLATAAGTAQGATASTSASGTAGAVLASGAGTAGPPLAAAGAGAGLAPGTGAAQSPVIAIGAVAVPAAGTGIALNATASTSSSGTASPAAATAAGTAQSPVAAIGVNATAATGAGTALNATASTAAFTNAQAVLASGAGAALNAGVTLAAIIPATPATGTGATGQATPAIGTAATTATAAGTARTIGRAAPAGLPAGTGPAAAATAALAYTAQATAAQALATALNVTTPATYGTTRQAALAIPHAEAGTMTLARAQ